MNKKQFCSTIALFTFEQQKDLVITALWSLRQKIRMLPKKEGRKVAVRGHHIVLCDDPETLIPLTVNAVPDDAARALQILTDCLSIVFSQEDAMALDVIKSFAHLQSEKGKIEHFACTLAKAMILEEGIFLRDRQMIFLKKEDEEMLTFVSPVEIENNFVRLLAGRIEEKKKSAIVF